MKFYTYGNIESPTIMLIHGGGLSHVMFENVAKLLQLDYYVVLPLLDGHREEKDITYETSKQEAQKICQYIKENHNNKLLLLGGASLGAQIAVEVLSNLDIEVKYSVLESGIYSKKPLLKTMICNKPMIKFLMKMNNKKWITKKSFKTYNWPNDFFDEFDENLKSLSYESNLNLFKSYFNCQPLENLKNRETKAIIIYGSKEKSAIKKDAIMISKYFKNHTIKELKNYNHCEISISYAYKYIKLVKELII